MLPDLVIGDQHITKLSPALIYSVRPGLSLQGEFTRILAGKNTLSSNAFVLGVVLTH